MEHFVSLYMPDATFYLGDYHWALPDKGHRVMVLKIGFIQSVYNDTWAGDPWGLVGDLSLSVCGDGWFDLLLHTGNSMGNRCAASPRPRVQWDRKYTTVLSSRRLR